MNCDVAREAWSARLDGEPLEVDEQALQAHLQECAACCAWLEAAHEVTRRARLSPARAVPDRTDELVAAVASDHSHRQPVRHALWTRLALAVLAVAQLVAVILVQVLGHPDGHQHSAREVGAFSLALAVGFLIAAVQPTRARGMSPLVGVAALALLATAVPDLAAGHTHLIEEVPHALAGAGWLLLHHLSGRQFRQTPLGPAGAGHRTGPPRHLVRGPRAGWRSSSPPAPILLVPNQGLLRLGSPGCSAGQRASTPCCIDPIPAESA